MSSKDLSQTYQKKTDIEHIKDAPDTYIGSVEPDSVKNWSFNGDNISYNTYDWVPGLYKLFDEGIVNCRDHVIRLQQWKKEKRKNICPVTTIDITVDKQTGMITMLNDGNGIDVEKHPEHKIWIPQMIFGELRTSTNYDKTEKKIVGGKNGFGFKLVLIYSKYGRIETVDHIRKKKYTQEFKNNLDEICKPIIKKCIKKPYTKVEFLPDYERFGMQDGLTDDMYNLFKKRVYDIAAVTGKKIRVRFNGEEVPIKTFENYISMYIGEKEETKRIYEKYSDRWEYAVCLTPQDEFTQVSFVNGVYTSKGGKHVEYILNQIVKKISEYIKKKKKITVKPMTIKEQLMIFVNCVIENPSFDSQTKDYMNTPVSRFGSKCEVSDKVINKLIKFGVVDSAISLTEIKDKKSAKKTDGRKTRNIRGIPKLIDANKAGTSKSGDCTLILCEGDSAKAGIVSGLSKEDRDYYGVFPLKGKLLNTLDAPQKKINDNVEITNIKKILGLETNKSYAELEIRKKSLRYGKVLIMTDQDLDGAHIKGLCINMFQSQWRELVKVSNFIGFMNTPILKATKGKKVKSFYNEADYKKWKNKNNGGKGWKIKYYKGLGTSTAKEFKEYFAQKKVVMFSHSGLTCDNAIDKVFNKKRADDRKEWLGKYDRESVLNVDESNIPYSDFVDMEMIHFSKYDCERSIPNAMDGLKISTRKILFAAKKRNLVNEIKVAQFAGYVSEHACYHHGEMSLNKAIIGLAQEYVGSNNINILMPNGQFGTRLQGGKDHASERYIFTQLNSLSKYIYIEADDNVLNYLDDDGTMVEPDMYAPIIPMCIVNGGKGIGTGFSYDGLSYNPLQIVQYLKYKLNGDEEKCDDIEFMPYYEGFTGEVNKLTDTKYLIKGTHKIISSDSVRVTELPIGLWTDDYKQHLESLMDEGKKGKKPLIKTFNDMSTDSQIDFTIKFNSGVLQKLAPENSDYGCSLLEKKLKLYTTKNTTNMHLFDSKQQLKKYTSVNDIIDIYYYYRHRIYIKRKNFLVAKLTKEVQVLSNKARFIKEQCDDIIDLRRKKKQEVITMLDERGYDIIDEDNEYKYLRTMKIEDVEEENMEKLLRQRDIKIKELNSLKKTTIEAMWKNELDLFVEKYQEYKCERASRLLGKEIKKRRRKKVKLTKN